MCSGKKLLQLCNATCQYGLKSLRSVSNIVLNVCHKELKHFIKRKQVLASCKLCSGLHVHLKSKKISCFIPGGDTDPFGVALKRKKICQVKHLSLSVVVSHCEWWSSWKLLYLRNVNVCSVSLTSWVLYPHISRLAFLAPHLLYSSIKCLSLCKQ